MHGNFSEDRVISQFSDFIHSSQFRPKSRLTINADGNIHRYTLATESNSGKSGAYALHLDGCPSGLVMDWHDRATKITWKYDFSDEERREYGREINNAESRTEIEAQRKEHERRKAEEKKLQEKKQQEALSMALREYLYADLFGQFQHPYLRTRFTDKGIHIEHSTVFNSWDVQTDDEPENYRPVQRMPIAISRGRVQGGLCRNGELIVPMLNVLTGKIQSLIHILATPNQEGKFLKRNYTGLTITGAAHVLRPKFSENAGSGCLFVTEGIATALALLIDTQEKFMIFSAGTCHNLIHVCRGLRIRYPGKKIIIVADNDESGAGKKAADECRNAGLADGIRMPEITGQDWYDKFITKKGN